MPRQNYPVPLIGAHLQVHVPVSFESNEVGTFKLPAFGFRVKVVEFESVVTKTVAGSNAGTITLKNGDDTVGAITVALDSAIGDEDEDTSLANTTFEATEQMTLVTAKSTAGGRGIAVVTYEVLPHSAT